jgi:hypothetical protein
MQPMDVDFALMAFEPTAGAERAYGDLTSEELAPAEVRRQPQRRLSADTVTRSAELAGSLATSGPATLRWTDH